MTQDKISLYPAIYRSMIGKYSVYALQVISMIIMARVFTPEQFGKVATVQVILVFFQLLTEAGIGPALINVDKLSKEDRNGIFTISLVAGFLFSFSFIGLSETIEQFYNVHEISEIIPYIAISVFFYSICIYPNAALMRDQKFYQIAVASFFGELIATFFVIVSSHVMLPPLVALATKPLVSSLIQFCILYYFSKYTELGRAVPGKKLSAIKPILAFSLYQFGFNFINYFSRNLDNILIGKYLGVATLGVYEKSYQLMRYPLLLLTFAMTPAIQPALRKHRNEPSEIEKIHSDFSIKLIYIGLITGLLTYFSSYYIVLILLGDQWLGVVPIIKIFSLSIPIQVVLSTSGSFFQTLERADLLFFSGVISAVCMVSAIVAGVVQKDVLLLSEYLLIAFNINFIQTYIIMYRFALKINPLVFFRRMFVPLLLSVLITGGGLSVLTWGF
ncbi:oligosaccharide flippase family protein [Pseudomonas sp. B21-048]|uniref:oligosaccharide flippase family protein n=1 Tax=Pseudomonas sp. B21-048 TaxID=2895490 RepID=UPI00215E5A46|nr:oligosaccharide flippase family protein [Pseudomonas sp. B21-048]UVL00654.1 oligosaccharide flippase family protein [Pseudomonas sp. B21-048]